MSKKFRTMLTIVLALVMTACVASFVACGYVASCNHNYVDGVCTYCNERDPSWKYGVTITNKDDLEAQWLEASQTRELAVKITIGGGEVSDLDYSAIDYIVETSDASVVSVDDDNKTLTAKSEGTATITVSVLDRYTGDVATDSVEIAVIPYLRGVQILNKDALSEVWTVAETSRELQLGFNPEYYNKNNPECTVTSDNEEVLTVGTDKKTLTAVKEGTATVTVTAKDAVGNEHKDTVKLTIRPVLSNLAIENRNALTANWNDWTADRTIGVKMEPADYYTAENTPVVVTFGTEGILAADGLTLSAKKVGTTTVTVSYAGKEDSFTVTVERVAPFVEFAETANFTESELFFGVYENEATAIPAMTATTCDGTALTAEIKLVQEGTAAKLENGVLTAPQGDYQLVYTVTDSDDESLVTTKTVNVTVARRLIGWNGENKAWKVVGNEFVKEEEQKLTAESSSDQFMALNYEPSKYYYIEVEFTSGQYYNAGIANFICNEKGEVQTSKAFLSLVHYKVNAKDHTQYSQIDFDLKKGTHTVDTCRNESGYICMYGTDTVTNRALKEHADSTSSKRVSKMAVARVGDYFVCFWNDQYMSMYTAEVYANGNTVPGMVVKGGLEGTTATKINYIGGEEKVNEKLAALTQNGKTVNTAYAPESWAKASATGRFTSFGVTEEDGLSFQNTHNSSSFNNNMVSNYVWFEKDFTYSWDYVKTGNGKTPDTNDKFGMLAEIRTSNGNSAYGGNGKDPNCIQFGGLWKLGEFKGLKFNYTSGSSSPDVDPAGIDASKGFRFTITRKLYPTYAEIHLIATSLADGKSYGKTLKYGATADSSKGILAESKWNNAVTVQWHNTYVLGKYTNITWTNEAVVTEHTAHAYGNTTYAWSDDLTTCTATHSCQYYGCSHVETEKVNVTTSVKAATCTDKEVTTYTATFTNAAFKTQTKSKETADALGHNMVDVPAQDSTEEAVGWNAYKKCDNPGCTHTEGYVEIPKKGSAPTLTLTESAILVKNEDGTYTWSIMAGEEANIPAAKALTWKGVDVSESVQEALVETTGATLTGGVLTASQGTYQLTYTVADPVNPDRVTTVTVTVNAYRNLIASYNTSNAWKYVEDAQYVEDSEQKLTAKSSTDQFMAFNYEPSKYYYIEAELVGSKYNAGITNYVYIDGNIDLTKTFIGIVHDKDGAEAVAMDYDLTRTSNNGYQKVFGCRNELYYTYMYTKNSTEYRKLSENVKDGIKTSKIAIARMGDYFLMFWNGQYISMYTAEYYANNATVPGLVVEGDKGATTVQNIVYKNDQQTVEQLVLQLTDNYKAFNTAYVPDKAYKNSYNNNLFTSNGVTEENGLSFTYTADKQAFNDSCVTNYVWFAEDFTYSWEYVNEGGTVTENKNREGMMAEIRTFRNYTAPGGDGKMQLGAYYKEGSFAGLKVGTDKITEGVDGSQGFKFTYKRTVDKTNQKTVVTMIAESLADHKTYEKTYEFTGWSKSDGCWNDAFTVQFHNTDSKGTYRNITWKNSVDA